MAEQTEPMQVEIAGRVYPLHVRASEKENIQIAAKLIGERISLYEKSYAVKDKQDLLAMCLLNFATELGNLSTLEDDNRLLTGRIKETEAFISNYLNEIVL